MTPPDSSELNRPTEDSPRHLSLDMASEAQALFLSRLRLLLERRYGAGIGSLTFDQRRILDKAIYSTFCDCLELDVSSQARALLQQHRDS